jgi:hypothetical protein
MVSGESHYYRGRRYRLRVVETDGPPKVELNSRHTLMLTPAEVGLQTTANGCCNVGIASACASLFLASSVSGRTSSASV